MRISRPYIVLLSCIITQACNPGVNEMLPDAKNLVSINSFISPQDTVIVAYLFHGQPFETTADPTLAAIRDATVTLSDGECTDTLFFTGEKLRYEAEVDDLSIEPLKTYTLYVLLKNGQELRASCTVPDAPESAVVHGTRDGDDYKFSVSWSSQYPRYTLLSTDAAGMHEVTTPSGPVMAKLFAMLDNGSFVLSNENVNLESGKVRRAFRAESSQLVVYLRNIDRGMYLYYKSFRALDDWHSNTDNLIPNFREPKPLFSNVEGGVGVFAAHNLRQTNIVIK